MKKAVAYSRVLGPKMAMTPNNLPIMLAAPPFDDTVTPPWEAMSKVAQKHMGIYPHPSHWEVVHTYKVKPAALELIGRSKRPDQPAYERIYILEYLPERAMRKHKGIDETTVHKFLHPGNSWYTTVAEETTK